MANPPGVVCLEGDWEHFESTITFRPCLELLENLGLIRFVHRHAATTDELRHNLNRWLGSRRQGYDFCYLAYHGSPGSLDLVRADRGTDEVAGEGIGLTLDDLADMLGTNARGRIIHFGSCEVLSVPDAELIEFCRKTKLRAISGYTKEVDWATSAAFEIVAIDALCRASQLKTAYTKLCSDHPVLVSRLGFKMATQKWVGVNS